MLAMYAEDAVFDVSAVFTDVAPLRGHQNMRRYWDEVWEIRPEDERIIRAQLVPDLAAALSVAESSASENP